MTDVGSTPRKPLTPTQRLKLFEAHKGICCLCERKIQAGEVWIDEHLTPLGLGGSNETANRGPAHEACAAGKTNGKDGDLATIAKAKRRKMKHLGIRPQTKLQGQGFSKAPPQRSATRPLEKWRGF